MIRRLWLIFAQTFTVAAGAYAAWQLCGAALSPKTPAAPAGQAACAEAGDLSAAVAKAAPAVVTILARQDVPGKNAEQVGSNWNSNPEMHLSTLGSGVIVSSDGYVLTNYHVVASVKSLYVGLADGRRFEARVRGSDPETDLALLKVNAENLPAAELHDSRGLKVGQTVLAIGNPFDVGQTVTSGIISGLGRHGLGLNSYEDFIQTDAAINQGNSGGALVDAEGRLIGINTAIFSPDSSDGFIGISFAIPSAIIERVLPSLKEGKRVERGYLGCMPRQLSAEFAQDIGLSVDHGVMVSHVIPESPAAKGGIRPFDVILEIGGKKIERVNAMLQLIAELKPGEPVPVRVLRGSREIELTVVPSARPRNSLERETLMPSAVETLPPKEPPRGKRRQ
ncbi:MAG: PDZ domain-containing protein [Burkholderia sp.]|jgi:serine protease DegQ